jgi:TolA-binding protein
VRATLAFLRGAGASALAACALALALPAHAGIFDDDEARRAILDLRKQLEQSNEQARARQNEQMAQMSTQIDQLKRSLLELNGNIEVQRADNAKMRGQMEELTRTVAEMQRKQTDLQQGVEGDQPA